MIRIDMKMPKCCGDCDLENNGCFCVVTGDNTFFYRNKWRMDNCPLRPLDDENRGAVSMALMDLPSAQPETNCSEFPNNSDTISRQAAIDAVEALAYHADKYVIDSDVHEVHGFRTGLAVAERQLSLVPSAQPERKMGKWIKLDAHAHLADHKCSACGQECYVPTCMGDSMYDYCPNCGARMKEGEEHD